MRSGFHPLESPEQLIRVACACLKVLLHLDLVLIIICSFLDQLILMPVCPASKPGAVVQGMRAGARLQPALLEVEASAGARSLKVTVVSA